MGVHKAGERNVMTFPPPFAPPHNRSATICLSLREFALTCTAICTANLSQENTVQALSFFREEACTVAILLTLAYF